MDQYMKISIKKLKTIINDLPDDLPVMLFSTDFDSDEKISDVGIFVTKDTINNLADRSKTIIYSGNKYLAHVDMHSFYQKDIYNIEPRGVMKTILLDGLK